MILSISNSAGRGAGLEFGTIAEIERRSLESGDVIKKAPGYGRGARLQVPISEKGFPFATLMLPDLTF
jgi:hypothetical protein